MYFSCYYIRCRDSLCPIRCNKQTMYPILPPGSISRCAHFPFGHVVILTMDHVSETQARLPLRVTSGFRSRFPDGCVVGQVLGMGRTDSYG